MSVKVRFAPSPTGFLHVGNARTAVITWLFCRQQNGHFLLRIDDTDRERSKEEYELAIEDGLAWLGLDWDEKTNQKDRMDRYEEVIEQLKADGRLYACYETPEELGLKRKTQLSRGLPPTYDRAGLSLTEEQIAKYEAEGRKPHWRFKLNHAPIEWTDLIRGPVQFKGEDMSDPVVLREDGSPLYHLCSVIDDVDFGISHVVRGEDHVSNTATHVQMFEAIQGKAPEFAHLSLISDAEGGKLSKRLGSLSVKDIQEQDGLEPMSVVSLMSRLGTSDPIESFTDIKPLIDSFDFSKFSRSTPKFDPDELIRLNSKILHETDFGSVQVRLANMGLQDMDETFWQAVRPNLEKLEDAKEWWNMVNGNVTPAIAEEDADFAAQASELLPPAPWNENTWSEWIGKTKEATGRKGKTLFMPIRKALTGMEHGPELADLLPLLGPEKTKERLNTKKAA
ncbi:MAG: glutamate--tRNA ligase [Alphaproteobacteria bacterium]|nr:glutamate--tRNA ligase [Alphaproteobacteria bacterium]